MVADSVPDVPSFLGLPDGHWVHMDFPLNTLGRECGVWGGEGREREKRERREGESLRARSGVFS